MSAYKNQANKRPAQQKETLNVAETDAKLKTAKPSAGTASGKPFGPVTYINKVSE